MKDKRKLYNYHVDEIEEDFLEWRAGYIYIYIAVGLNWARNNYERFFIRLKGFLKLCV